MRIEWLVVDVPAVGSPDRVTCYFVGDFGLALFWETQAVFIGGEPLCDVGIPSKALIGLFRII